MFLALLLIYIYHFDFICRFTCRPQMNLTETPLVQSRHHEQLVVKIVVVVLVSYVNQVVVAGVLAGDVPVLRN